MPTYDYKCDNCGYIFEHFQSMSDDALTTCPDCGQESLKRLIGGGMGVIFKGSGFYVNDAKKSSSTSQPLKDKAAAGASASSGDSSASKTGTSKTAS